eukprot:1161939-Pelagomonas_calceolata.AAC.7
MCSYLGHNASAQATRHDACRGAAAAAAAVLHIWGACQNFSLPPDSSKQQQQLCMSQGLHSQLIHCRLIRDSSSSSSSSGATQSLSRSLVHATTALQLCTKQGWELVSSCQQALGNLPTHQRHMRVVCQHIRDT